MEAWIVEGFHLTGVCLSKSTKLTTGGLRLKSRNISKMIQRNWKHLSLILCHSKESEYLCQCDSSNFNTFANNSEILLLPRHYGLLSVKIMEKNEFKLFQHKVATLQNVKSEGVWVYSECSVYGQPCLLKNYVHTQLYYISTKITFVSYQK